MSNVYRIYVDERDQGVMLQRPDTALYTEECHCEDEGVPCHMWRVFRLRNVVYGFGQDGPEVRMYYATEQSHMTMETLQ